MMQVRIKIVGSAQQDLVGREISVQGPTAWIGRADTCDVVVKERSISGRHARLELGAEGTLTIHDNASSNGVRVDGRKVQEAEVQPGRQFTLGGVTFLLLEEKGEDFGGLIGGGRTMMVPRMGEIAQEFENPRPLDDKGELATMAANRPIVVSDSSSVWIVGSGRVDLFTIALEKGEPKGTRTHFVTVEPGQAFFGINAEDFGYESGFLAVGKTGSEIYRFSLEHLQLLAKVQGHREQIANMIDVWVESLSQRLTKEFQTPPEPEILLRAGEKTEVEPDKIMAPAKGVVWIAMPAAQFFFDGMTSFSYELEGVLLPLARGSWIELLTSDKKLVLEPRATIDGVRHARLWAGLEAFHRILCECEFLNKKIALANEYVRLGRRADELDRAQEVAMDAIEGVMGGAQPWEEPTSVGDDIAPLLRACALVGEKMGIDVRAHPNPRPNRAYEDALFDIATASSFRIRKVKLEDGWWKSDEGPFLAQREEDDAPVAVLPTGTSSYEFVDPLTGVRTKVTAAVAYSLAGFGYAFYTPLPSGSLDTRGLLRFAVRGLKGEFRTVLLMGLGVGVLSMMTPLITGKVFDNAIPQAERHTLIEFTLGLLLVGLTTAAFQITQKVAVLRVQGKMDYSVQAAVWGRLMDLPMGFFRDYTSGDLADRAGGVAKIRDIVSGAGVGAILGSIASLFNVVQMALYSFTLAGVGILLALTYITLTFIANYIQIRYQREELWRFGMIRGLVLQLITGVAKLRVSGAENHAFRVWATQFADQRKVSFKVGRVGNFIAVINSGFTVLASLAIFATMVYLKKKAAGGGDEFEFTTGDFLAFSAAFGIFLSAMQALGDASVSMLRVIPTLERLKPILEAEPEVDVSKAAPGVLQGGIEISHVRFRYTEGGPWILDDVSLKIKPGDFVGIVGGSGSGKSTLMRLMLGFERPGMGGVYYDGQDLGTLDLRMVRQQLGVVLQDSRVLPAEIYRNIVGASSRSVDDAWEAARQAGLDKDIQLMPMGMHTYVTEGGGGLSGGQKQRLMIARALVNEPKVIFLDEATSALDNKTQATVTESMDRLNATRIVIAHRLSTIKNADRIFYLESGKVKEQGKYDELMEMNGAFAQLARRQLV